MRPRTSAQHYLGRLKDRWTRLRAGLRELAREFARYPSAIVGLALLTVLVGGSVHSVVALPYLEIGETRHAVNLTGKVTVPKNAPARRVNWFRLRDLPSTVIRSSQESTIEKEMSRQPDGDPQIVFTMELDYPYEGFPQDVLLYINSSYEGKRPHVSITWITPDGREIKPKSPAIRSQNTYRFSDYLVVRGFLRRNEYWREWFVTDGPSPTPPFYVLFAQPEAREATALPGKYRLVVTVLPFGENTDVDLEFVLIGGVYGWAGTDYLRRDLLVPLLWGLSFALTFGLVGATLTTILAMVVAAAGAWFGGWVDGRALWGGGGYWVLEPIGLLLFTALAFVLLGFGLEAVLNPRLRKA